MSCALVAFICAASAASDSASVIQIVERTRTAERGTIETDANGAEDRGDEHAQAATGTPPRR